MKGSLLVFILEKIFEMNIRASATIVVETNTKNHRQISY